MRAFGKTRLLMTFTGYVVVTLVAIGFLINQGMTSLDNHKQEIEKYVSERMRTVGLSFTRDLENEWLAFLELEKLRKFYEYQPVMVPDTSRFASSGRGYERSPLHETVRQTRNLIFRGDPRKNLLDAPSASVSLGQVFGNSLVGYFQYDPTSGEFTTPYDDTVHFTTPPDDVSYIDQYRRFLADELRIHLIQELGLDADPPAELSRLLRPFSRRLTEVTEDLRQVDIADIYGPDIARLVVEKGQPLEVQYYDMVFLTPKYRDEQYKQDRHIVCCRAVVLNDYLLIQGFLFNAQLLIQEAQGYLEDAQPQYGHVVVDFFDNPLYSERLFQPFDLLAVDFRMSGDEAYLRSYQDEKRFFWIVVAFLSVAYVVSMFHLGTLIHFNMDLFRKKTNFISSITHELKAPLTSIIMYAEMLCEGWARGKEATYYRYILWESERLSRLIKNILDYSGLERGTFKFTVTPVDLADFVAETLRPLEVWIENNELILDLEVRAKPRVSIDRDSLAQVFYNLCDNAIKYGRSEGESRLTIVIDEDERAGVLRVFDNGPGVSKREADKIFRLFYRGENEMTREHTGTGLGLALVLELVEGNGGDIEYDPPKQGGFGVRITFPKLSDADLENGTDTEG